MAIFFGEGPVVQDDGHGFAGLGAFLQKLHGAMGIGFIQHGGDFVQQYQGRILQQGQDKTQAAIDANAQTGQ